MLRIKAFFGITLFLTLLAVLCSADMVIDGVNRTPGQTSSGGGGGGGGGEDLGATLTLGNNAASLGASNVGHLVFSATNNYGVGVEDAFIGIQSVDGADTNAFNISASRAVDANRSAYAILAGNEHTLQGKVLIHGGAAPNGEIAIQSGNETNTFTVRDNGVFWGDNLVLTNTLQAVTNGGTIGGIASTAIIDFAKAPYWHLTATQQNIQILVTNFVPTNRTAQMWLQINASGALGSATATFNNVWAPGSNRVFTLGSGTNAVDVFGLLWPGWGTNQTVGKWIVTEHLSTVR